MRKITDNAVNAFLNRKAFNGNNTTVTDENVRVNNSNIIFNNCFVLRLFTNAIAFYTEDKKLFITNCGYQTNTTKERLNGLPNVRIQQKKGVWYLNGKEWNGELIEVK